MSPWANASDFVTRSRDELVALVEIANPFLVALLTVPGGTLAGGQPGIPARDRWPLLIKPRSVSPRW